MSNQNMKEVQVFVSSLLTCVVTYFNQKMGVSSEIKIPIAESDFGILEPEDGEILMLRSQIMSRAENILGNKLFHHKFTFSWSTN